MESLLEKLTNDKVQADVGLRDWPIATGSAPLYLDSLPWTWSSAGHRVFPAKVPGDLISDLFNAGIIDDPLFNTTFKLKSLGCNGMGAVNAPRMLLLKLPVPPRV